MKSFIASFIQKIKQFFSQLTLKRGAFFAVGVLVVVVIVTKIFSSPDSNDTVVVVTRGDVSDQVVLSGRTQSASAVKLGFADQGRVKKVFVTEGDRVRAGQVLAQLDIADLNASLANAEAALTIAKAGVSSDTQNLEKVVQQQDALVYNAYRKMLSDGLEAVPEEVDYDFEAPTISGTYEGPEGEYIVEIYGANANSGQAFKVSGLETGYTGEVSTITAVALGTHGLYIKFGTGNYIGKKYIVSIPNRRSSTYITNENAYRAALVARDLAITNAEASLNRNSVSQSVAQAKVEQARSTVASIEAQIERRTIRAPFDGIIAENLLKVGQTTSALSASGDAGSITLISENDYEVVLKTPEISVAKLAVGQEVSLQLDAYGPGVVFSGKIVSINPAETIVDGVPVYETKVAFNESDSRIRSGMTTTATIVSAKRDQVLKLPASYISKDATGTYVSLVLSDGVFEKRMIETGLRGSDSVVEIISGLNEGDQVSLVAHD